MKKISGVYKITNTVTGDFYIGSSKDVKRRLSRHKCPSSWNEQPNNPMYQDMKRYGLDYFVFEILEEVEIDSLKETEQQFIEKLKPTYNNIRAKGVDIERYKKSQRKAKNKYRKSDKCKEYNKEYNKEYRKSDKYKEYNKEYQKEYRKSDKYKEYQKEYKNKLCLYNSETLTLAALSMRFRRAGVEHYTKEAKKYIIKT